MSENVPAEPASKGVPTEPASKGAPTEPASKGAPTEPASKGVLDVVRDEIIRTKNETIELVHEAHDECVPSNMSKGAIKQQVIAAYDASKSFIHIPYFPAFHRPGWFLRYLIGPYDADWIESAIADVKAGITVGLTLIPQGLSYATLANLPPIYGLYAAILPSATYTFFGSGLQLAVGPVALVSLLMGELMVKYQPDYATNIPAALDTAAQASLCCGIILTAMGLLNLGELIRFISHPVMSGFTTAAAMLIGINQLKGMFGFIGICNTSTITKKSNGNLYYGNGVPPWCPVSVPQAGKEVHYNWEVMHWFAKYWTYHFTIDDIVRPLVPMVYTCQSYQRPPLTSYSYGSNCTVTSNDTYVGTTERQNTQNYYRSYLYTDVQAVVPTAFPTIQPPTNGGPTAVPSTYTPTYAPTSISPVTLDYFTTTKGHNIKNPYAIAIGWGTFIPLVIFLLINKRIKARTNKKVLEKSILFKIFDFAVTCLPFAAIIIGANIAWRIKHSDDYNSNWVQGSVPTISPTIAVPSSLPTTFAPSINPYTRFTGVKLVHEFYKKKLDIVGEVAAGIDILRTPKMRHPFGSFFADVIPLTLIAFMESYSVARRLAVLRNELHILNASQEMIANGLANLLGCVSSAYPVSGSFSRSSLNHASGARTPLSKVTCLLVVITALMTLADQFQYIPKAVLSAVIFLALYNLVVISEFWEAWCRSKKDFFIMLSTAVIVFVFDTSIGLAVGLGLSFGIYVFELFVSPHNAPQIVYSAGTNDGFAVVKIESDLGFIHAPAIKDFITKLYQQEQQPPADKSDRSIAMRYQISSTFDRYLINKSKLTHVDVLPKGTHSYSLTH
jgi:MFS superfamily sulfate permease-like transporter